MFPVGFSFIPGSKAWPEVGKIYTFHSGSLGTPGLPEACRAAAQLPPVSPPDPLTPGIGDLFTGRASAQPELLPVGNPVSPQWEKESWGEVKVQGGKGSSSQLALGPTPPLGGVEAVGDKQTPGSQLEKVRGRSGPRASSSLTPGLTPPAPPAAGLGPVQPLRGEGHPQGSGPSASARGQGVTGGSGGLTMRSQVPGPGPSPV